MDLVCRRIGATWDSIWPQKNHIKSSKYDTQITIIIIINGIRWCVTGQCAQSKSIHTYNTYVHHNMYYTKCRSFQFQTSRIYFPIGVFISSFRRRSFAKRMTSSRLPVSESYIYEWIIRYTIRVNVTFKHTHTHTLKRFSISQFT